MASIDKHHLLRDLKGSLGKQLVVKQYTDKIVVTRHPDMRRIKPTELQLLYKTLFAEAVAYAQSINRDRQQRAIYLQKVKKGESVYHYALKEYLRVHKPKRGSEWRKEGV